VRTPLCILFLSLFLGVGCDSSSQPPEKDAVQAVNPEAEAPAPTPAEEPAGEAAEEAPPTAQVEAEPGAAAATVKLVGTVTHKPAPRGVKSVAAFTGDEFFLETDDGRKVVLQPSEAHSKESLEALDGARVEIEAEETEGTLPDPRESSPSGPDGEPMRRNAGFIVRSVRSL